jgi:hypothetical protein
MIKYYKFSYSECTYYVAYQHNTGKCKYLGYATGLDDIPSGEELKKRLHDRPRWESLSTIDDAIRGEFGSGLTEISFEEKMTLCKFLRGEKVTKETTTTTTINSGVQS